MSLIFSIIGRDVTTSPPSRSSAGAGWIIAPTWRPAAAAFNVQARAFRPYSFLDQALSSLPVMYRVQWRPAVCLSRPGPRGRDGGEEAAPVGGLRRLKLGVSWEEGCVPCDQ